MGVKCNTSTHAQYEIGRIQSLLSDMLCELSSNSPSYRNVKYQLNKAIGRCILLSNELSEVREDSGSNDRRKKISSGLRELAAKNYGEEGISVEEIERVLGISSILPNSYDPYDVDMLADLIDSDKN